MTHRYAREKVSCAHIAPIRFFVAGNGLFLGLGSARIVTDSYRYPKAHSNCMRKPNPALNLAPFGRWTLRHKAAQRRLASR
jgi:hypothetical protein